MPEEIKKHDFDFKKLSSKDWWNKIDEDLKGKARDKLYRPIVEDLRTKPFYHFDDDQPQSENFQYQKRETDFLNDPSWLLGQNFHLRNGNENEIAELIKEAIEGDCQYIELRFEDSFNDKIISKILQDYKGRVILQSQNSKPLKEYSQLFSTTIGNTVISDPDYLGTIIEDNVLESELLLNSKIVPINSNYLINRGANAIEEGIYILACLNHLVGKFTVSEIKPQFLLRLNTGSDFFLQIAKLRSLRTLANFILKKWNIENDLIIEAQSSRWNKSVYDRFTNILRLTSESFAAIVGSVDILNISGFEDSLQIENGFTHRNARNISHLLKHESHLDKVYDHAAGSYYVENLCEQYSELVWKGFQEIENNGGIVEFNKKHNIKNKLQESRKASELLFGDGKIKMVGTNSFPNPLDELTKENILEREPDRLAFKFEKLRALVDLNCINSNGKRPSATLCKSGDSEMRFARAGFSTNFLESAGIKIEETDTISKNLANSDFAVICSGDEDYINNATDWAKEIKKNYPDIILILAGNPENKAHLEKAGVDFFIHLRAPLENTLTEILKSIGIAKT